MSSSVSSRACSMALPPTLTTTIWPWNLLMYGSASLEHHQAADAEVEAVEGQLGPAVTQRANDATPVGVAPMHGGLDEARRGDSAGGCPGFLIGLRALDADSDHLGRTLTVARDRPRELATDVHDRSLQRLRFDGAGVHGRIACGTVGEQQERVVGRAVAVDRDLVEAAVSDRSGQLRHEAGFDRRVGGDIRQH